MAVKNMFFIGKGKCYMQPNDTTVIG